MEDIFEFVLNILEELGKSILPSKMKTWYKKQKRRIQVILEAIFDLIIIFLALFCFDMIVSLFILFLGLFGIDFEG